MDINDVGLNLYVFIYTAHRVHSCSFPIIKVRKPSMIMISLLLFPDLVSGVIVHWPVIYSTFRLKVTDFLLET